LRVIEDKNIKIFIQEAVGIMGDMRSIARSAQK
jgi:hypothetical protein